MTDRNLDVYQFYWVPFGIICSPFLLAEIIKYDLKQIGTTVASQIGLRRLCQHDFRHNRHTKASSIMSYNRSSFSIIEAYRLTIDSL